MDQIATSAVAKRKSAEFSKSWIYGMRMIVAIEALIPARQKRDASRILYDVETYIEPIARMKATTILVREFIFKSLTINTGMIARIQSAKQDILE